MSAATVEAVPLSASCICGDVRLDHKMGKGACKVTNCGCDQYEQLDGPPVEPATAVPVDGIAGLLDRAVATEVPRLVKAADKIQDLIDQLEGEVAVYERGNELRAEAEKLEQRLAEIREQLGTKRPVTSVDNKAIRAWAADNGIDCPAVGRVPGHVIEAYQQAQS